MDAAAHLYVRLCEGVFVDEAGKPVKNPTITLDEKRTTQDDPFDRWLADTIKRLDLPGLQVFTSGPLTHPDIVLQTSIVPGSPFVGIEVKKLNADEKGRDPRGMTIDFNSTAPCGTFRVYRPDDTPLDIPGYYIFVLLDHRIQSRSRNILTFILSDGDLLNDDFDLYLASKTLNESTYDHGPYGEGSVRGRMMYVYPNPLDSKITALSGEVSLIHESGNLHQILPELRLLYRVSRQKKDGTRREFSVYRHRNLVPHAELGPLSLELFARARQRSAKKRSAYKFVLPAGTA
jgi:hypothetical protein